MPLIFPGATRSRIVLIEGNMFQRLALVDILTLCQYKCIAFENTQKAEVFLTGVAGSLPSSSSASRRRTRKTSQCADSERPLPVSTKQGPPSCGFPQVAHTSAFRESPSRHSGEYRAWRPVARGGVAGVLASDESVQGRSNSPSYTSCCPSPEKHAAVSSLHHLPPVPPLHYTHRESSASLRDSTCLESSVTSFAESRVSLRNSRRELRAMTYECSDSQITRDPKHLESGNLSPDGGDASRSVDECRLAEAGNQCPAYGKTERALCARSYKSVAFSAVPGKRSQSKFTRSGTLPSSWEERPLSQAITQTQAVQPSMKSLAVLDLGIQHAAAGVRGWKATAMLRDTTSEPPDEGTGGKRGAGDGDHSSQLLSLKGILGQGKRSGKSDPLPSTGKASDGRQANGRSDVMPPFRTGMRRSQSPVENNAERRSAARELEHAEEEEGLQIRSEQAVELVLCDRNAPGMEDFGFLRFIRDNMDPWLSSLPVVVIGASLDEATRITCMALGARACLPKPLTLPVIKTLFTFFNFSSKRSSRNGGKRCGSDAGGLSSRGTSARTRLPRRYQEVHELTGRQDEPETSSLICASNGDTSTPSYCRSPVFRGPSFSIEDKKSACCDVEAERKVKRSLGTSTTDDRRADVSTTERRDTTKEVGRTGEDFFLVTTASAAWERARDAHGSSHSSPEFSDGRSVSPPEMTVASLPGSAVASPYSSTRRALTPGPPKGKPSSLRPTSSARSDRSVSLSTAVLLSSSGPPSSPPSSSSVPASSCVSEQHRLPCLATAADRCLMRGIGAVAKSNDSERRRALPKTPREFQNKPDEEIERLAKKGSICAASASRCGSSVQQEGMQRDGTSEGGVHHGAMLQRSRSNQAESPSCHVPENAPSVVISLSSLRSSSSRILQLPFCRQADDEGESHYEGSSVHEKSSLSGSYQSHYERRMHTAAGLLRSVHMPISTQHTRRGETAEERGRRATGGDRWSRSSGCSVVQAERGGIQAKLPGERAADSEENHSAFSRTGEDDDELATRSLGHHSTGLRVLPFDTADSRRSPQVFSLANVPTEPRVYEYLGRSTTTSPPSSGVRTHQPSVSSSFEIEKKKLCAELFQERDTRWECERMPPRTHSSGPGFNSPSSVSSSCVLACPYSACSPLYVLPAVAHASDDGVSETAFPRLSSICPRTEPQDDCQSSFASEAASVKSKPCTQQLSSIGRGGEGPVRTATSGCESSSPESSLDSPGGLCEDSRTPATSYPLVGREAVTGAQQSVSPRENASGSTHRKAGSVIQSGSHAAPSAANVPAARMDLRRMFASCSKKPPVLVRCAEHCERAAPRDDDQGAPVSSPASGDAEHEAKGDTTASRALPPEAPELDETPPAGEELEQQSGDESQSLDESCSEGDSSSLSEDERKRFSVYERVSTIDRGATSYVHLVKRLPDMKAFAHKEILLECMAPSEQELAKNEVRVLKAVRDPPMIAYSDSWIDPGHTLNIIIEYARGGSLQAYLERAKLGGVPIPTTLVQKWTAQISVGLLVLHEMHIIHRDLKTSNILLTDELDVRLCDFGISRSLSSAHEMAHTAVGTPYIMSPELCQGKPYNAASDIWALGVVMFEMLELRRPFSGDSLHALFYAIQSGDLSFRSSYDLPATKTEVLPRSDSDRGTGAAQDIHAPPPAGGLQDASDVGREQHASYISARRSVLASGGDSGSRGRLPQVMEMRSDEGSEGDRRDATDGCTQTEGGHEEDLWNGQTSERPILRDVGGGEQRQEPALGPRSRVASTEMSRDVRAELQALCASLLRKDPAARPSSLDVCTSAVLCDEVCAFIRSHRPSDGPRLLCMLADHRVGKAPPSSCSCSRSTASDESSSSARGSCEEPASQPVGEATPPDRSDLGLTRPTYRPASAETCAGELGSRTSKADIGDRANEGQLNRMAPDLLLEGASTSASDRPRELGDFAGATRGSESGSGDLSEAEERHSAPFCASASMPISAPSSAAVSPEDSANGDGERELYVVEEGEEEEDDENDEEREAGKKTEGRLVEDLQGDGACPVAPKQHTVARTKGDRPSDGVECGIAAAAGSARNALQLTKDGDPCPHQRSSVCFLSTTPPSLTAKQENHMKDRWRSGEGAARLSTRASSSPHLDDERLLKPAADRDVSRALSKGESTSSGSLGPSCTSSSSWDFQSPASLSMPSSLTSFPASVSSLELACRERCGTCGQVCPCSGSSESFLSAPLSPAPFLHALSVSCQAPSLSLDPVHVRRGRSFSPWLVPGASDLEATASRAGADSPCEQALPHETQPGRLGGGGETGSFREVSDTPEDPQRAPWQQRAACVPGPQAREADGPSSGCGDASAPVFEGSCPTGDGRNENEGGEAERALGKRQGLEQYRERNSGVGGDIQSSDAEGLSRGSAATGEVTRKEAPEGGLGGSLMQGGGHQRFADAAHAGAPEAATKTEPASGNAACPPGSASFHSVPAAPEQAASLPLFATPSSPSIRVALVLPVSPSPAVLAGFSSPFLHSTSSPPPPQRAPFLPSRLPLTLGSRLCCTDTPILTPFPLLPWSSSSHGSLSASFASSPSSSVTRSFPTPPASSVPLSRLSTPDVCRTPPSPLASISTQSSPGVSQRTEMRSAVFAGSSALPTRPRGSQEHAGEVSRPPDAEAQLAGSQSRGGRGPPIARNSAFSASRLSFISLQLSRKRRATSARASAGCRARVGLQSTAGRLSAGRRLWERKPATASPESHGNRMEDPSEEEHGDQPGARRADRRGSRNLLWQDCRYSEKLSTTGRSPGHEGPDDGKSATNGCTRGQEPSDESGRARRYGGHASDSGQADNPILPLSWSASNTDERAGPGTTPSLLSPAETRCSDAWSQRREAAGVPGSFAASPVLSTFATRSACPVSPFLSPPALRPYSLSSSLSLFEASASLPRGSKASSSASRAFSSLALTRPRLLSSAFHPRNACDGRAKEAISEEVETAQSATRETPKAAEKSCEPATLQQAFPFLRFDSQLPHEGQHYTGCPRGASEQAANTLAPASNAQGSHAHPQAPELCSTSTGPGGKQVRPVQDGGEICEGCSFAGADDCRRPRVRSLADAGEGASWYCECLQRAPGLLKPFSTQAELQAGTDDFRGQSRSAVDGAGSLTRCSSAPFRHWDACSYPSSIHEHRRPLPWTALASPSPPPPVTCSRCLRGEAISEAPLSARPPSALALSGAAAPPPLHPSNAFPTPLALRSSAPARCVRPEPWSCGSLDALLRGRRKAREKRERGVVESIERKQKSSELQRQGAGGTCPEPLRGLAGRCRGDDRAAPESPSSRGGDACRLGDSGVIPSGHLLLRDAQQCAADRLRSARTLIAVAIALRSVFLRESVLLHPASRGAVLALPPRLASAVRLCSVHRSASTCRSERGRPAPSPSCRSASLSLLRASRLAYRKYLLALCPLRQTRRRETCAASAGCRPDSGRAETCAAARQRQPTGNWSRMKRHLARVGAYVFVALLLFSPVLTSLQRCRSFGDDLEVACSSPACPGLSSFLHPSRPQRRRHLLPFTARSLSSATRSVASGFLPAVTDPACSAFSLHSRSTAVSPVSHRSPAETCGGTGTGGCASAPSQACLWPQVARCRASSNTRTHSALTPSSQRRGSGQTRVREDSGGLPVDSQLSGQDERGRRWGDWELQGGKHEETVNSFMTLGGTGLVTSLVACLLVLSYGVKALAESLSARGDDAEYLAGGKTNAASRDMRQRTCCSDHSCRARLPAQGEAAQGGVEAPLVLDCIQAFLSASRPAAVDVLMGLLEARVCAVSPWQDSAEDTSPRPLPALHPSLCSGRRDLSVARLSSSISPLGGLRRAVDPADSPESSEIALSAVAPGRLGPSLDAYGTFISFSWDAATEPLNLRRVALSRLCRAYESWQNTQRAYVLSLAFRATSPSGEKGLLRSTVASPSEAWRPSEGEKKEPISGCLVTGAEMLDRETALGREEDRDWEQAPVSAEDDSEPPDVAGNSAEDMRMEDESRVCLEGSSRAHPVELSALLLEAYLALFPSSSSGASSADCATAGFFASESGDRLASRDRRGRSSLSSPTSSSPSRPVCCCSSCLSVSCANDAGACLLQRTDQRRRTGAMQSPVEKTCRPDAESSQFALWCCPPEMLGIDLRAIRASDAFRRFEEDLAALASLSVLELLRLSSEERKAFFLNIAQLLRRHVALLSLEAPFATSQPCLVSKHVVSAGVAGISMFRLGVQLAVASVGMGVQSAGIRLPLGNVRSRSKRDTEGTAAADEAERSAKRPLRGGFMCLAHSRDGANCPACAANRQQTLKVSNSASQQGSRDMDALALLHGRLRRPPAKASMPPVHDWAHSRLSDCAHGCVKPPRVADEGEQREGYCDRARDRRREPRRQCYCVAGQELSLPLIRERIFLLSSSATERRRSLIAQESCPHHLRPPTSPAPEAPSSFSLSSHLASVSSCSTIRQRDDVTATRETLSTVGERGAHPEDRDAGEHEAEGGGKTNRAYGVETENITEGERETGMERSQKGERKAAIGLATGNTETDAPEIYRRPWSQNIWRELAQRVVDARVACLLHEFAPFSSLTIFHPGSCDTQLSRLTASMIGETVRLTSSSVTLPSYFAWSPSFSSSLPILASAPVVPLPPPLACRRHGLEHSSACSSLLSPSSLQGMPGCISSPVIASAQPQAQPASSSRFGTERRLSASSMSAYSSLSSRSPCPSSQGSCPSSSLSSSRCSSPAASRPRFPSCRVAISEAGRGSCLFRRRERKPHMWSDQANAGEDLQSKVARTALRFPDDETCERVVSVTSHPRSVELEDTWRSNLCRQPGGRECANCARCIPLTGNQEAVLLKGGRKCNPACCVASAASCTGKGREPHARGTSDNGVFFEFLMGLYGPAAYQLSGLTSDSERRGRGRHAEGSVVLGGKQRGKACMEEADRQSALRRKARKAREGAKNARELALLGWILRHSGSSFDSSVAKEAVENALLGEFEWRFYEENALLE
ncbi:hypothetical protein BESB_021440 [Besnoitia besnoiti]|uniref:non-specific serine/threonine protein kinase n=1 Tax=Besnoitia besnoiti TaxID=94643 RepID=A0A2A9M941_BESBE|nr:hypothetical protein BESB_021440 [Besnoitia besnoiti]PFH32203.1 hypothetical protein BESB_021440 [Besnoitia besnoiti]